MEAASVSLGHAAPGDGHHEHHGPPPANSSSRVEPQLLGMLLFIISEIMVFGAFFTAYFFIRVVAGSEWFPTAEFELPRAVAGVNTAILLSSSLTMHWALESIKHGNRAGLKAGLFLTMVLGGAFLVEVVYSFPGLGLYTLNSILKAETAPIVASTLLVATLYLFANLIVDVVYVVIDPRIRYA